MKTSRLIILLCACPTLCAASEFDVRAFGATGDGSAKDTAAIQKAIDTAAAQGVLEAAGGEVVTVDGEPLRYGKPRFSNPHFIARSKALG